MDKGERGVPGPTWGVCSGKTSKQSYRGRFWRAGVVDLVVLACVLRATTKKVANFLSCPQILYSRTAPATNGSFQP